MPTLEDLFILHTAKSGGFVGHEPGDVAFVTNGFRENGVLGFVTPRPRERVFRFLGIALSAFAEATVQAPPFIARGNGGSGLIVLEPRRPMSADALAEVAALINTGIRWRFSWYRQASVDRIRRLQIPEPTGGNGTFRVGATLLPATVQRQPRWPKQFAGVVLESIYDLRSGDYHGAAQLPRGETPLVSCGDANNGIMDFVQVPPEHIYDHRLTIAFNGMNTLNAKYHPYPFAAKDDVAVCVPHKPLRRATEVFIRVMLNRERWRYSHYRKCFMEKLRRFAVPLPVRKGQIDEDAIQEVLDAHPYWKAIESRLA